MRKIQGFSNYDIDDDSKTVKCLNTNKFLPPFTYNGKIYYKMYSDKGRKLLLPIEELFVSESEYEVIASSNGIDFFRKNLSVLEHCGFKTARILSAIKNKTKYQNFNWRFS